jgi:hypothetical protein
MFYFVLYVMARMAVEELLNDVDEDELKLLPEGGLDYSKRVAVAADNYGQVLKKKKALLSPSFFVSFLK